MDLDAIIPTAIRDSLKCFLCKNYLSYFPIRIIAESLNICGRCEVPEGQDVIQNSVSESLLQLLKFPCRYNEEGCEEEFLPADVPKHENNCPYSTVPCPVRETQACEWQGQRYEILNHCKSTHVEMFLKDNMCQMDMGSTEKEVSLLEHEDNLLFFCRQFGTTENCFLFEVYSDEFQLQPIRYPCKITVISCDNSNMNIVYNVQSKIYEEREKCSTINLASLLPYSCLILKISFDKSVSDAKNEIDLKLLSTFECALCGVYVLPPLYICSLEGSFYCEHCFDKHQNELHKNCVKSQTNEKIEQLANSLNYPCKNYKKGCTFVAKPVDMQKHTFSSTKEEMKCPLSEYYIFCEWKGIFEELKIHLRNDHSPCGNGREFRTRISRTHHAIVAIFIEFSGFFFLIVRKQDVTKHMWTVQLVGPFVDGFKYQIEIVDRLNRGRILLVRKECEALTKKEDVFGEGRRFCSFSKDELSDFVTRNFLTYRVRIFK